MTGSLEEILTRGRRITEFYYSLYGKWDLSYSLLHIHSEISEVFEAIRKNQPQEERNREIKEELGDVFLTWLEACHTANLKDYEIEKMIFDDLLKAENRIKRY